MSRQQQPAQELFNEFVDLIGPTLGSTLGSGMRNVLGGSRNTATRSTKVPVDIVNDEKTIYIYAEIPGVSKESIDVDFYNNKLTITVEKSRPYENPEMSEIKYGHCERTLTLPICVTRKDAVAVSYNNGILKVKINKLVEEENKFSVKITE